MTHEDQVFIVDVVVINPTREMVATSVISRPVDVTTKLNTILKIRKYKKLHEKHHFILMAVEVHGAPGCDMNHFFRKCARLFSDIQSKNHLILFVCI
jgi:hypothetical protein